MKIINLKKLNTNYIKSVDTYALVMIKFLTLFSIKRRFPLYINFIKILITLIFS